MATVRTASAYQRVVLFTTSTGAATTPSAAHWRIVPALRLTYDRGMLEIMTTSSGA